MPDEKMNTQILQSIAYHWSEADIATLHFPNSKGLAHTPQTTVKTTIGRVIDLPVELLHNILCELDFQSLGVMRLTNSHTRAIVESLPAYRDITSIAHGTLRALSSTRIISHFSSKHLYSLLCSGRCSTCEGFGGFLHLAKGVRSCFTCMTTHPSLDTTSASGASKCFGLTAGAVRRGVVIVDTLPGMYSLGDTVARRRAKVVSAEDARNLAISIYGSEEEMLHAAVKGEKRDSRSSKVGSREIYAGPADTGEPHDPRPDHIMLRFRASTPFPSLDTKTKRVERGLNYRGCEISWYQHEGASLAAEVYRDMNKAFTEEEFLGHFEACDGAGMLWTKFVLKGKGIEEADRSTRFRM